MALHLCCKEFEWCSFLKSKLPETLPRNSIFKVCLNSTGKMSPYVAGKVPDMGDLTEKEIIKAERNSGVISNRVREIQVSACIQLICSSL